MQGERRTPLPSNPPPRVLQTKRSLFLGPFPNSCKIHRLQDTLAQIHKQNPARAPGWQLPRRASLAGCVNLGGAVIACSFCRADGRTDGRLDGLARWRGHAPLWRTLNFTFKSRLTLPRRSASINETLYHVAKRRLFAMGEKEKEKKKSIGFNKLPYSDGQLLERLHCVNKLLPTLFSRGARHGIFMDVIFF